MRSQTCSTPRSWRSATESRQSAAGRPVRAASSSALGVTRKRSWTRSASRAALATDTGSKASGTPAAAAAATTSATWAWARLPSTTTRAASVEVERVQLERVDDGHVGHRGHELAAVVEDRGVGARCAPGTRRTAATSAPHAAVTRSASSPNASSPTADTSRTGAPSRPRQAAMLRPTPPGEIRVWPGLLVAGDERRGGPGDDVHVGAADDHHPLLHAQILTEGSRTHSQDPHRWLPRRCQPGGPRVRSHDPPPGRPHRTSYDDSARAPAATRASGSPPAAPCGSRCCW